MSDECQTEKQLQESIDKGFEIAKSLIDPSKKTCASAATLGNAAAILYWALVNQSGYEEDAKNWLEVFFRVFESQLRQRDINLSITYSRKDRSAEEGNLFERL